MHRLIKITQAVLGIDKLYGEHLRLSNILWKWVFIYFLYEISSSHLRV